MANGDAAAAVGMDVVPDISDLRKGYDEINKTRDYIANHRTSNAGHTVAQITGLQAALDGKGGTGEVAAAAASAAAASAAAGTAQATANANAALLNTVYTGGFAGDVWNRNITGTRRAAWIGDGGVIVLGHTASTRTVKQDFALPKFTTAQLRGVQVTLYRYIAEVERAKAERGYKAALEIGVIAEELHELGLWPWVVYEGRGKKAVPVSVHYELLGLLAILLAQQAWDTLDNHEERLAALEKSRNDG